MFSTDATIHTAQDLIYSIQKPAQASPLFKLENAHKEALISLAEIFIKATPPVVPPRVPVRGSYQEKLHQVNQERNQMKNVSLSNPFTNV